MIRLSEAEWKVMNVLWEEAPQTIMQLTHRFQETTGWTKHTIMTFLKRMEDKGAVYYENGTRAKLYYPKIERQEAVLQETEEFLERVFDGRMGLMLNTMVENRALSGKEIAELYEILGRAEASCGEDAEGAEDGKDGGRQ
ncbi:MAG: BlaI/MecI/CopY family transcriptional regulator [Lachnospiraceae bacterium]|nr:BlaI/MecI/CopY family transcriptional regulator [Lachnospiraceae bacterium]